MVEPTNTLSLQWLPIDGRTDCWGLDVRINGQRLLDLIHDWEEEREPDDAKKITLSHAPIFYYYGRYLYGWLNEKLHRNDTAPEHRATILGCRCGEIGCWPLQATVTLAEGTVTWSDFFQPFRPESTLYQDFGPYIFDRIQYETEVRRAIDESPMPRPLPPVSVPEALQQVRDAFAGVARPVELAASPYVAEKDRLERLTSVPLDGCSPDDLAWYAARAITTVGTEQDFLYFLPALLEDAMQDDSAFDMEVVFRKARQCALTEEQDTALKRLLLARWAELLQSHENRSTWLNELLTAASCFNLSWQPFWQHWESLEGLNPALQLAYFIQQHAERLQDREQFNAFLDEYAVSDLNMLRWWLENERTANWIERCEPLTVNPQEKGLFHAAKQWVKQRLLAE